jgi:hypothetical protein
MKKVFENHHINNIIPEEKILINYLNDQLTSEEKRALEELINEDPMIGDAVEGLYEMKDRKDLKKINQSLSLNIETQIRKKRKKKIFQPLGFPLWMVLLITMTLLVTLGGYVLISLLHK